MQTTSMNKATKRVTIGRSVFPLVLLAILLIPGTAHAYVDPGSGSVIVTTILGLLAAIGYTFRKYFYKLKRFFTSSNSEDDLSDDK